MAKKLDNADRNQTAFTSQLGLYRFIRILFGLLSALGIFQQSMNIILPAVKVHSVLVYFDDVVVSLKSPEEHMVQVRSVLTTLSDAGALLKHRKCLSSEETIAYLGHVVRPTRLENELHPTDAIRTLQPPAFQTKL